MRALIDMKYEILMKTEIELEKNRTGNEFRRKREKENRQKEDIRHSTRDEDHIEQ